MYYVCTACYLAHCAVGGYLSSLSLGAITLADGTHPLGRMVYQTVNDTDINAQHIQVQGMDCCCCYGWQNMQNNAHPNSSYTPATLMAMWTPAAGTTFTAPASFLVQVRFFVGDYGVLLRFFFSSFAGECHVNAALCAGLCL